MQPSHTGSYCDSYDLISIYMLHLTLVPPIQ